MLELKKTLHVGNVVKLAIYAILILTFAGCGSENGGTAPSAGVESPAAVMTTAPPAPVKETEPQYKFVDDSFATAKAPPKPEWDDTAAVRVVAMNRTNGELTEETIMAAIKEGGMNTAALQGGLTHE